MTTTRAFQSRPDSYPSRKECEVASKAKRYQTNQRYSSFTQTHFTAGDEEQFQAYRDATNGSVCIPEIDISNNLFIEQPFPTWEKYRDVGATAVIGTFRYIFNKFKKGIFIKIQGNRLVVFLPFSKANFKNEWASQIHIDPKYRGLDEFLKAYTGGYHYNPRSVNKNVSEWYANNCIVRYDVNPHTRRPNEGDSNVGAVKNMLEVLCAQRIVPDIEFFMNRRDFPLLTRDGTEPYDNIWGDRPLVSYDIPKYLPILSMCKTDRYADILVPTHEDWARVQSLNNVWFPRSCRDYNEVFDISWGDKKDVAVFRGASTGCGVTIETNPRLKLAYISAQYRKNHEDDPLIDAGITKWNLRPRKLKGAEYLQSIDIETLKEKGVSLVDHMTLQQQSSYRYIINVDGHVSAFRLSIELGMGSVVLLVESKWKLWYSDLLVPYKHYVPIKSDLSDLIQQIKWCRDNDAKCQEIVVNSRNFFNTYLQEKGILDYLQKIIVDMKTETGVYLYNIHTPLDVQLKSELSSLSLSYPETDKSSVDIKEIPWLARRCYGLLQGVHWAINLSLHEKTFATIVRKDEKIFTNKLGIINRYTLGRANAQGMFSLAVKSTSDVNKSREHIHEAYVGTKAINQLLKHIPNFTYTFGLYRGNEGTTNVINEYIAGMTLSEYLGSRDFEFNTFLFIMAQVCLAIQVAQNKCGLVHYDLTPWNIILQPSKNTSMDYVLGPNQVIRVQTDVVPVIIDYGKSHVIVDQQHHGFTNMFKVSTIQDMLSLLLTSISTIREKQRLPHGDFINMLHLADFVSGTTYRKEKFRRAEDLRNFLRQATSYFDLSYGPKYELEEKTPMDMFDWIIKIGTSSNPSERHPRPYKFLSRISKAKFSKYNMDSGNGRQIFEYILSSTTEERAQTYFHVFERLKHCTIPQPDNLFFAYYAVQVLSRNLHSVKEEMERFLHATNTSRPAVEHGRKKVGKPMAAETYLLAYNESMSYLERVYRPLLNKMHEEEINYDIEGNFSHLEEALYTAETFLDPSKVSTLIQKMSGNMKDLSSCWSMITSILIDTGTYKLTDEDHKYYMLHFSKLLQTNPLNMQNNVANDVTLRLLATSIYNEDLDSLASQLPGQGDCSSAQDYLRKYKNILSLL